MSQVTPNQVLMQFRLDVDDILPDPDDFEDQSAALWSDPEIYYYMDRAQQALCARTHYLQGETQLPVIAGQEFVNLPARVIQIRELHLVNAGRNVALKNANDMSGFVADDYGLQVRGRWRTASGGPPQMAILDLVMQRIRLVPTPQQDDMMIAMAEFLPAPVSEGRFSIPREDHIWVLLPYMKYLAYSKQDADAYDPNRAQIYQQQAEAEFERVYSELQQLRRSGSGTTRYGGL